MLIQVNTNGLGPEAGGTVAIEDRVRRRLSRFASRLTRVQMHFEDVNADRGGSCDKRCLIELRPHGASPIAVSDCSDRVGRSIAGATAKAIAALNRHFGKIDLRR